MIVSKWKEETNNCYGALYGRDDVAKKEERKHDPRVRPSAGEK